MFIPLNMTFSFDAWKKWRTGMTEEWNGQFPLTSFLAVKDSSAEVNERSGEQEICAALWFEREGGKGHNPK